MTVETPQRQQDPTTTEQLAKGIDRLIITLAYISPLALLVLLVSDTARDYGVVVMILGFVLGFFSSVILQLRG